MYTNKNGLRKKKKKGGRLRKEQCLNQGQELVPEGGLNPQSPDCPISLLFVTALRLLNRPVLGSGDTAVYKTDNMCWEKQ
jgi:hypothetical protein